MSDPDEKGGKFQIVPLLRFDEQTREWVSQPGGLQAQHSQAAEPAAVPTPQPMADAMAEWGALVHPAGIKRNREDREAQPRHTCTHTQAQMHT